MQNLYQLLGIPNFVPFEEIALAYQKKHTELFNSDSPLANIPKLKELKDAFDLLSDEKKRQQYDEELYEFLQEVEIEFDSAIESFVAGELDVAIQKINYCLTKNPGEPDYYETLGLIYRLQGDLDNSLRSYKQGLQTGQNKGVFNRGIADVYRLKHDEENADTHFLNAAEDFKEVLKSDPKNVLAIEQLADIYRKILFYDESIELYRQLIKRFPYNAAYHRDIASVFYEVEMFEEAEFHLLEALRISPGDAPSLLYLGLVYFKRRLLTLALQTLQDSLKQSPDQPEVIQLIKQIEMIRASIGKTVEEIIFDPTPDAYVEGEVKWYNPQTGMGVLSCDEFPEVLLHYTALAKIEEKNLKKGDPVRFGVVKDPMSPIAVNIEILSEPTSSDVVPGKIIRVDSEKALGLIATYENVEVFFNFSDLSEEVLNNICEGLDVLVEYQPVLGISEEKFYKATRVRLRKRFAPPSK